MHLKDKFWRIINIITNQFQTNQFEDSEYKYDMITGFLNSNQDLGKYSSGIQISWDRHQNWLSC